MIPYKTIAHIHSLDGEMAEITVLDKITDKNEYIVDYNGIKCTAIYNWYNCTYYADDIYGKIKTPEN